MSDCDTYHEYECPECSRFYKDCTCWLVCPNCGDLDAENVGQVDSKHCCISCGEYLDNTSAVQDVNESKKGEKHV